MMNSSNRQSINSDSHFLILVFICLFVAFGLSACGGEDVTGTDGEEEETEEVNVSEEDGIETMLAFLGDNDLLPDISASKLSVSVENSMSSDLIIEALEDQDFVSTQIDDPDVDFDEEDLDDADLEVTDDGFSLGLWVGPDGHLIPNGEWRDENQDICKLQQRTMKPANSYISFKIYPVNKTVYAQMIDVETSVIDHQAEVEGSGDNWLKDTIEEAWDELDVSVEASEGPCADKVPAELSFRSEIQTDDTDGHSYFSHVEAEIELTYNEEEGFYEGSGTVEHKEFTSSVDGDCTVPDGTMIIHELRLPEAEEIPEGEIDWPMEDTELVMGFEEFDMATCTEGGEDVPPQFWFDWSSLRLEGEGQLDTSKEPWQFILNDWEGSPDEDTVIGHKYIEQTVSGDAGGGTTDTISEETLFEIVRKDMDDL